MNNVLTLTVKKEKRTIILKQVILTETDSQMGIRLLILWKSIAHKHCVERNQAVFDITQTPQNSCQTTHVDKGGI